MLKTGTSDRRKGQSLYKGHPFNMDYLSFEKGQLHNRISGSKLFFAERLFQQQGSAGVQGIIKWVEQLLGLVGTEPS